jgi:hypothetical protein
MRTVALGVLVVCLLLGSTGPAAADDQAEMKALVDKAIKAAGGKTKVAGLKALTWKGKGKVRVKGNEASITIDASMQALDQVRLEMTAEFNGQMESVALIINQDKGWFKDPRRVEAAPQEILTFLKADLYALRLAQTLVPLKHKDCKLSALGEIKIDDRPALGIKAVRKGFPEVDVFFDKESGLPIKCQVQVKEDKGDETRTHELFFSKPKKTDGLVHFTKFTFKRADKEMIEVELSDIKPVDKVDDTQFAKPE